MIKTPDIGDKQVTERKLADGSVTSSKLSTEIANMLSLLTTRISAFKVADNLSSLPTEENTIGWLVDNHLYVYVGNGSTPESGMYQDCGELRGPQGIQGEQGLSGLNGKSAYDIWIEQPDNEGKSETDFLEFTRGSKGDKGDQGERGYDISNIEQIVKSTEDGGKNIIRVTRSDGWSKVFEILNGSKGSKGDKGTSIVKLEQTRKTTESSGLNTIEATLDDGTKESFEIYNGAKGEQGDKGEKGDKGDQGEIGPQGNSGIADASNKTLVNDAITGGETDFLSAEVGKLGILTYDCSKGGSVTHDTLQDAINSVPTTFQKVGLTITYKSGDTIYRYTLKANAWSADPANWFSVEDKLSDLCERVEIIPDSVWNDGDGTVYEPVVKGKSRSNMLPYHEDFQISEKPFSTLFFGSDKTFLGKSTESIVSSYSGTKYIAFVWDTIPDVVQYSFFLEKDTKANFDLINSEERLFCKKGYRNLEGNFVPFDSLVSTDYIPIETNSIILLLKSQSGNIFPNLCYYDVNKKFVGKYAYKIGGIIDRIVISDGIPSDARYITVNAEVNDNAKVKIYDGSGKDVLYMDRTVYEPFSLTWKDLKNGSFVSDEFIPVTDASYLLSNGGRMYRLQYYDSDKNLIVNSDITFDDGDVKGQDASFEYGRFCDYNIAIPNGYGIKYVKVFKYPEKYKDYVLFVSQSLSQLAADVNKTWKGKKLVTIGDSLTANTGWQQIVADTLGLVWSYQETCNGEGYVNINDGTYTKEDKSGDSSYRRAYPMAMGGTTTRPVSINSIYMRMWDAKYYNPDIIIIYAGENDPIEDSNPWGDSNLSAKELVESTTPYKEKKISLSVNAMAAYKGMVEILSTLCPKAKIYLLTCMRVRCDVGKVATAGKFEGKARFETLSDVIAYDKLDRFKRQEYVKAIGEYYGVPVIDLMNDCGATHFNQNFWYDETAYDGTQVHPNMFGRKMMAKCIISKI